MSELRDNHRDLEADFAKVVEERDQLYDTFEGAVRAVQQKSDFRCEYKLQITLPCCRVRHGDTCVNVVMKLVVMIRTCADVLLAEKMSYSMLRVLPLPAVTYTQRPVAGR